jgi:transcriptional regulator with XRE-family HTH domain
MLQKINPKSPDPIDVNVGEKVRIFRNFKKMSQEKLAEHIGITFQQVQKYEKGRNRISCSKLVKIAESLDISPAQLISDFMPEQSNDTLLTAVMAENAGLKDRLRQITQSAKI